MTSGGKLAKCVRGAPRDNEDNRLLDELTAQAQASPRLRMNLDLRNSVEDDSQRMLNAIEPGSVVPIHRHRTTSETVVILRGRAVQYLYDDAGNETGQVLLAAGAGERYGDCGDEGWGV